jgi:hypothetical protein
MERVSISCYMCPLPSTLNEGNGGRTLKGDVPVTRTILIQPGGSTLLSLNSIGVPDK